MRLTDRWIRPPAELRRLFAGDERLLALADTASSVAAGTNLGLWLPVAGADPGWIRTGWELIVKATWDDGGLTVIAGDLDTDGIVTDRAPIRVELSEPRNLPSVVRARVESSIGRSEQVPVTGGSARIVARRVPGQDGVTWTARLDTGTPPSPAALDTLRNYLAGASRSNA